MSSTEELIAQLRSEYLELQAHRFDYWLRSWAESPIEQLVIAQMLQAGWEHPTYAAFELKRRQLSEIGLAPRPFAALIDSGGFEWCLFQVDADGYRLDAVFIVDDDIVRCPPLIIELDGHDFHERTKEQAQRDKSRDRHFTERGWPVMRFTGSEVWRTEGQIVLESYVTWSNNLLRERDSR